LDLLPCVINSLDHVGCQVLEQLCETMFFLCGVALGGTGFGGGGDTAVRIETAEGAIAFGEDATTFFNEGLNLLDKFFFVKFLFRCPVGFFNRLESENKY
jgi:hypothetical protein